MIRYDSAVIYQFADELEAKAKQVVWTCTIRMGLIGALFGVGLGSSIPWFAGWIDALIGAGIAGFVGFIVGINWSFRIRLQLHTMLCQVQIEENTRPRQPLEARGDSIREALLARGMAR